MDNGRHERIAGNGTCCFSCKFYEPAEKPQNLPGWNDGYCTYGWLQINSKKYKRDRVPVRNMAPYCDNYVDYYDGATKDMIAGFEPMPTSVKHKGDEDDRP